jgi:hypothetical protein
MQGQYKQGRETQSDRMLMKSPEAVRWSHLVRRPVFDLPSGLPEMSEFVIADFVITALFSFSLAMAHSTVVCRDGAPDQRHVQIGNRDRRARSRIDAEHLRQSGSAK